MYEPLILLPLIAGYIFLTNYVVTKYKIQRLDSYKLIFETAYYGFLLLGCSWIIVYLLKSLERRYTLIEDLISSWKSFVPFDYSGVLILTVIIASILGKLLNLRIRSNPWQLSEIMKAQGDIFENTLADAMLRNKLVSVTLRNHRVYIGFVTKAIETDKENKYIRILPLYSGYRVKDDLKMKIDKNYSHVYNKINDGSLPDLDIDDFNIVIPVSEILTLNLFNIDAYNEFQKLEKDQDQPEKNNYIKEFQAP